MTTQQQFESFTREVIDVLNNHSFDDRDKLQRIEDVAIEHGFVATDDDRRSNGGLEFFVP